LFLIGVRGSRARLQSINVLQGFDEAGGLGQVPNDRVIERLLDVAAVEAAEL